MTSWGVPSQGRFGRRPRSFVVEYAIAGRAKDAIGLIELRRSAGSEVGREVLYAVDALSEAARFDDARALLAHSTLADDQQERALAGVAELQERFEQAKLTIGSDEPLRFERRSGGLPQGQDQLDNWKNIEIDRQGITFNRDIRGEVRLLWSQLDNAHLIERERTTKSLKGIEYRYIERKLWIRLLESRRTRVIDLTAFRGPWMFPELILGAVRSHVQVESRPVDLLSTTVKPNLILLWICVLTAFNFAVLSGLLGAPQEDAARGRWTMYVLLAIGWVFAIWVRQLQVAVRDAPPFVSAESVH